MAGAGYKSFTSGDILTASQVNTYLMDQNIVNFASTAARSSAIPSPWKGLTTFLSDNNRIEIYDGSAWKTVYTQIFASSSARASALPSPPEGLMTYLSDDKRLEVYNGTAWKIVYLPPTAYTPTLNNAVRSSGSLYYSVAGNTMFIQGVLTMTSVSGAADISLPSGFTYNTNSWISRAITGINYYTIGAVNYIGTCDYASATTARFIVFNASGTYTSASTFSSTVPATWASGDKISVNMTVQIA